MRLGGLHRPSPTRSKTGSGFRPTVSSSVTLTSFFVHSSFKCPFGSWCLPQSTILRNLGRHLFSDRFRCPKFLSLFLDPVETSVPEFTPYASAVFPSLLVPPVPYVLRSPPVVMHPIFDHRTPVQIIRSVHPNQTPRLHPTRLFSVHTLSEESWSEVTLSLYTRSR